MKRHEKLFILKSFFIWRVVLIIVAILAIKYIPLFSDNFFGGKLENYIKNPLFWGWANFDGEHYLSIAMNGYKDLQQAFFPAYPILIKTFSNFFGLGIQSYLWSGIIISNLLFLASLTLLWKVVRLDYSEKVAKLATISLLLFPTSFYFASVYTESLFLFSSLLTYYLYRKNKYLLSGLVGILMTSTRIYGVFVLLMILVDILKNKPNLKNIITEKIYLVGLSIFGLLIYMFYSWKNYSDPLAFYNLQTLVGEQHQRGIVLLPQVFFRYIKIFINSHLPFYSLQTTLLEIVTAVMFIFLPIYAYIKKVRLSYIVYILLGLLVPAAQGSFSSIPRYLVVIFPAFIIMGMFLDKLQKLPKIVLFLISVIWLLINCSLFLRGYWIA